MGLSCYLRAMDDGWKAPWESEEQVGGVIEEDSWEVFKGEGQTGGGTSPLKYSERGQAENCHRIWTVCHSGNLNLNTPRLVPRWHQSSEIWGQPWVCRWSDLGSHYAKSEGRRRPWLLMIARYGDEGRHFYIWWDNQVCVFQWTTCWGHQFNLNSIFYKYWVLWSHDILRFFKNWSLLPEDNLSCLEGGFGQEIIYRVSLNLWNNWLINPAKWIHIFVN